MAGAWPIQARAETETMDQGDGVIACMAGGAELGQSCGWREVQTSAHFANRRHSE